jgi:hypothetical protein
VTGVYLLAWLVFPLLVIALSAGAGLAVRRVTGPDTLPAVLIVPVGLATLVVVAGFFCYYAASAPLAGPACAVVGGLGLLVGRRELSALRRGRGGGIDKWAVVAALGAWAVLAAPVVLSGEPTFTGYGRIVDTSYEFDLAVHFAHSGRSIPPGTLSAYRVVLAKYLGTGYPGGGQWTLGSLSNLMPVDLAWLYQPFLAFLSGVMALAIYSLLGPLVRLRTWRALAAIVAATPNVLVAYALAGGIKELSTITFLLVAAAAITPVLTRMRPGRGVLAVPIALAATIASFSLTSLPWVAVLSVGVAISVLTVHRGRLRAALAAIQVAVLTFILSLPTYASSLKLLPTVQGKGPVDLGNLSMPVPRITAAGVWIGSDIRFPQYAHQGLSEAFDIVALVLAAIGVAFALRRRAWSVAWLAAAGAVAIFYIDRRYGPWIQFKSYTITAPITLLLAFAGIGALMSIGRRALLGVIPAVVIAGAVLVGNAMLYHDTTLAPYARLHDLQQIGERYRGQGPTLTPDFEEYAEYFLRDDEQTSMVNGPALVLRPGLNRADEPGGTFQYDLDEYAPEWVESFRTIVMRRNPLASRPPSNYRLAYLSRWYEVWQRDAPAKTVLAHLPVTGEGSGRQPDVCATALALARRAGPGTEIAYSPSTSGYVQIDDSNAVLSGALQPAAGVVLANGAGKLERRQPIPAAGLYDFYLAGSFGRPVSVSVDGRKVAVAAYQASYPGEFLLVGTSRLSRGVHDIAVTRGGTSLHPGNGNGIDTFLRAIGPLVIVPAQPATPIVRYSDVGAFARACKASDPLHWVEVVRPA